MADTEYPNMGADANKERKELRIEQVRRLMLRGITAPIEIQKQLSGMGTRVTLRSIHRYKGIITKRNVLAVREKQGLNETVEELALKLKDTLEEVSKELWMQYHAPTVMRIKCTECSVCKDAGTTVEVRSQMGAIVKVSALKEIKAAAQEWIKNLQTLGLVSTAAQKHQLLDKDGNPIDPPQAEINVLQLSGDFTSFIKAKYQDPIGKLEAEKAAN